ncbi:DUF899 domain-containing protein [Dyella dinghuensis]|uniref:DUF899 domain-containing protein n=1 Tax=Dyella dinghuensis TaxID=1920169 RepID=A0A432LWA3_9GAMM|nr:DUF899 family protein [Dyella dinghuensis]RUL66370.1 DUF899 domain-containing protein [Dyella dinghuensis]
MKYEDVSGKLADYRRQIADIREKMRDAIATVEPKEVKDYEFAIASGTVRLSELFGDHEDLIVIHNMGVACSYCTLWADGYNGIHQHVVSRAGFVVSSPDSPNVQKKFAESRGWRFPMVSHADSSFAADMGYVSAKGGWMPGVSVFKRDGDAIVRVSDTGFSPGDDFCAIWHFFDMLPGGVGGWPGPVKKSSCCATS